MKISDRYLKIVYWSEEDQTYIGICPGLFRGGCNGPDELVVYQELSEIVDEVIQDYLDSGKDLPPATAIPENLFVLGKVA
jgi:predicted RNase H-like HicB family nuclease